MSKIVPRDPSVQVDVQVTQAYGSSNAVDPSTFLPHRTICTMYLDVRGRPVCSRVHFKPCKKTPNVLGLADQHICAT